MIKENVSYIYMEYYQALKMSERLSFMVTQMNWMEDINRN